MEEVQRKTLEICSEVLKRPVDFLNLEKSFLALGGDSLSAIEIVARARKDGISIMLHDFLQSETLEKLCKKVLARNSKLSQQRKNATAKLSNGSTKEQSSDRLFPLTPLQALYAKIPGVTVKLFRFKQDVPESVVHESLRDIVRRHELLRGRLVKGADGKSCQRAVASIESSLAYDVRPFSSAQACAAGLKAIRLSLDVHKGPVCAALNFVMDGKSQAIGLVLPQCFVDAASWRIIVEDLASRMTRKMKTEKLTNGFVNGGVNGHVNGELSNGSVNGAANDHVNGELTNGSVNGGANGHVNGEVKENFNVHAKRNPNGVANGLKRNSFLSWTSSQFSNNSERNFPTENRDRTSQPAENILSMLEVIASVDSLPTTRMELSLETTGLLFEDSSHVPLRTEPSDIVLAALALSVEPYGEKFGRSVLFTHICDGRMSVENSTDYSNAVGCFDIIQQFTLEKEKDETYMTVLRKVKDLRRGLNPQSVAEVRKLSFEPSANDSERGIQGSFVVDLSGISFSPNSQSSLLLPLSSEDALNSGFLATRSSKLPSVCVSASQGKDSLQFVFHSQSKSEAAYVKDLAKNFERCLTEILTLLQHQKPIVALSDLPHLPMTYLQLDNFVERLNRLDLNPLADLEAALPCSKMQAAILVTQAMAPNLYNCSFVVKMTSSANPIDVALLQASWEKIIDRHVFLRTIFVESESRLGCFDQLIFKKVSGHSQLLEMGSERRIDLSSPQPFSFDKYEAPHRMSILQQSSHQVFCKLESSHAIVDGSSVEILFRELCSEYHSKSSIDTVLSYLDLSSFQEKSQTNLSGDYWAGYLGQTPMSQFPVSKPEEESRDLQTIDSDIELGPDVMQRFCRLNGLTFAQVCQLAWGLVLQRFTGADEICFQYITSGRDVPVRGIEGAVGPFVSMLPCCLRFNESATVMDALERVKHDFIQSLPHQHVSAVSRCQDQASISKYGNTVMSFLRRSSEAANEESEMTYDYVNRFTPTDFDIAVHIQAHDGRFHVEIDFWSSKVDRVLAERISQTFGKAISSILEQPNEKIRKLSILSDTDRSKLEKWNGLQPESHSALLHELVRATTLQQPEAVAVSSWDGSLTYRELDTLAERLAQHLISLGVRPEIKVALSFDKSLWTVVSQLAVLKAGGVVVSIGTTNPIDRTKAILKDIASSIVLVGDAQASRLRGFAQHVITVDAALLASLRDTTTQSLVEPSSAAWIIYTSGSTGNPKGVILEHRTLSTTIRSHGPVYGITEHTRVLQFSAYTFDISIYDIFTTLCFGGCICILSEEDRVNNLAKGMREMGVTFASLTSTVASILHPEELPSLKTLILLGEPARPAVVEEWAPHATVLNAYGPAEGCVTTVGTLTSKEDASRIGFPLACRVWIVDPTDHTILNPIGVPGELLIEGGILARGYLNDPVKTERSFIVDPPFVQQYGFSPGRRMYRTGDLIQQDQDGVLRHLGRIDTQIKINGQRVEPGEIEYWAKILGHHVQRATVNMIRLGSQKDKPILSLALDFTNESPFYPHSGPVKDVLPLSESLHKMLDDLRSSLLDKVPAYMIPSIYVPIREIPQTTSSKVDRRGVCRILEGLDDEQLSLYSLADKEKQAPSTPEERLLQELWASVLRVPVEAIGAQDNFFRAGGDSLVAMQLVALCRKADVYLTVADIFRCPRLSQMATLVVEHKLDARLLGQIDEENEADDAPFSLWANDGDRHQYLVEIAEQCGVPLDNIQDVYPCTPLQEGLFTISMVQPHAYVFRQVFRLSDTIDIERFQKAWEAATQIVPILRTVIVPAQGVCGHNSRLLQVDLRLPMKWTRGSSLEEYLNNDRKLQIAHGRPLSRYAIIETHSELPERYFVWTAHHSTYDGPTLEKLYGLLEQIYAGNRTTPITSFKKFVAYLQQTDVGSDEVRSFWQSQLRGDVVPRFPEPLNSTYYPKPVHRLLHQMHDIPRRKDMPVTISTILRAAWALVIARYTGANDALFGVTVSGRMVPVTGITDIVGPTIATVPVRIRVDSKQTVHDFLINVQHQASIMMPFEHTGLQNIEKLVPDFSAQRDLRHLFVVQLAQDAETDKSVFPGLEHHSIDSQGFDSFPLNVVCTISDVGSSQIEVRFDEAVLAMPQVERLIHQFEHVFSQLSQGTSGLLVNEIDVVSPQDISQIRAWNGPLVEPYHACIHDLVTQQAQYQPDSMAISAWDGNIDYKELDVLANKLSAHLSSLGVGPEVKVALCFDKSKWAIIAMLAILKAGGVVVPLGVQHPMSRIRGILDDTSAKFILFGESQSERLKNLNANMLTVTPELIASLPGTAHPMHTLVKPSNAAFIIYTSGSTGLPKGVILDHQALCTSMRAHGKVFEMNPHRRVLQFAAYTFDATIQEVFTTLLFGGCICVISEEDRMDNLSSAMENMQVNCAGLTSTVAGLLHPSDLPSLQTLVLFGEPVKPAVVAEWAGRVKVINAYGPSECCIYSSAGPPLKNRNEAANIGFPLAGRFWIVDPSDRQRLNPIGVPGELLIEGPLLARGYLNDEDKTNRAFVKAPNWAHKYDLDAGRMYRTGDLVRQNSNGSFTHLGRIDAQIKINGQRIEPGEIEFWVKTLCSDIQDATVNLVQPGHSERRSLLAIALDFVDWTQYYSQPAPDVSVGLLPLSEKLRALLDRLRSSLLEAVPAYMVPALYVPMVQLPQTVSTKVDRRSICDLLESLDENQLSRYALTEVHKEAPSTVMETRLQEHWAAALSLPSQEASVGLQDNFFRAGGDSVAAMYLAATCRKAHIYLSVADIFQYPKFADLAAVAEKNEADEVLKSDQAQHDADNDAPFSLLGLTNSLEDVHMNNLLTEVSEQCAVPVEQIEDIYPCTPLQEGLFAVSMHQQQAYVFRQVFRLGSIDIHQFKQAWQTAAEMVSILRTVIVSAQGSRFLQVVLRKKLEWVKGTSLDAYLDADKCVPIQQGQPLSRYAVIESRPSERYFVWTSHHSAYDGHTLRKLYELVAAIYSHQPLPKIAPFKSFVKHLGATDPSKAKLFWQSQLQGNIPPGFPKLLDPEYQPQPTERLLYRLQVPRIALPVTISTMLRVAWALVLAKHTDTPDVIFGVTLSGRTAPVADVVEVAGPTITTVPIRLNLDPQLTIGEVLLAAQQQASAMITFEHTGLQNIQKLVSKSLPDLRHLFVVQLPQEEDNQADAIMPGLEPYMTDSQAFDSYPLNVHCTTGLDQSGAAKIEVRFDETVIPTHLVKTLLQQFDHVISRLGQLVDLPIGEVEVVHPSDIAQIRDWNRMIPEAQHSCIHELVHEQMNRQPNALAISSWDGNLTYVELDALATKLCRYLVSLGVGPEVMVGLCFDKSKWAIVAMLAVLKAGGTIVSLGVQQPISRIKGIIQDIVARVILVGPEHSDRFSTFDCQIVSIVPELFSHLPDTTEPDDSSRIPAIAKPSNAAIVIFTSGSTGTPKGVVSSHEALCTSIKAHGQAFGIGPETKALQFSAYTFDVSIQEIFTTLCFGGRICIISEDDRINNLVGAINKAGANFASLTSTVANLLQPNEVPLLKTLVLLGEPVRPAVVDSWANHAKVLNAYGPSECSIHSTVGLPLTKEAQVSNIGFPLSCRLWVVESSDYNKLCPIGTRGELLIEGPIQARGYLNDPEKTERAFINDPAWMKKYDFNSSGRRFYRTGDLVQQNPDGSLLHLGRKDTQIKINGQRVEPGEIENKLTQHEQIADAVVLYPKSGPCQSRLVGLLALRDLESGTVQGLEIQALGHERNDVRVSSIISSSREHLSHHVMSYMVPATWIVLTTMPLTATGKMNRLKLQSWLESMDHESFMAIAHKAPGVQSREPVSEEELKLRDVFIEVMGLQEAEIVLESSFISLGGDSVAAMQVVSRCRQMGVSMSVVDILRSKTIAELAAIIQSQRNGATSGKLPLQIEEMVDWHAEAALSLGMHDLAVTSAAKVRDKPIEILLTGSTGFLGNRILQKLASSQDVSRIHCVAVRLQGQGTSRMNPVQSEKVITYTGDLELPHLGLSDDEYRLFETCDAIIHCGAQVSYMQAYEALRGSNVQSTKELAQLALTYGIPIHFVSTIGVTRLSKQDTVGEGSVALYLPDDRGSGYTASGYVASKWVSEVFLENVSREFGMPVYIHRPSSIIGPGAPSMDIVNNLLQFSRKMRVAPKFTGWKGHVDAVEIDAVAANIVSSVMEPLRQSSKPSPMGVRYIHESGQLVLPFDGVKQYMEREEGAEFQTVSMSEWVQLALKNGMNELVAEYLNSVEQDGELPSMPLFETSRSYSRVNAQIAVHGTENAEGK